MSRIRKFAVGNTFTNKYGETCVVIEEISNQLAKVQFDGEFPHQKIVHKVQLSESRFVSNYNKSVYGVGMYVPYKGYKCRECTGGKITLEYNIWANMIKRAYCPQSYKEDPTYKGVTVHKPWHRSDVYWEWAEKQVGWRVEGYHQDKDLLVFNNKVYCPDTSVFIPSKLNSFLVDCRKVRSEFGQGVYFKDGNYKAVVWDNNKPIQLGRFKTQEEATLAFSEKKTEIGRLWGERLKAGEFEVDQRVIDKMLNYKWKPREREDVYGD